MSGVLVRLEQLRKADTDPTLQALGGFEELLADRERLLESAEMPILVSLLLHEWPHLPEPEKAAALIVDSIPLQNAFALEDIVDDALSCPEALPLLASPISRALRRRASGGDAESGIALEGLTRLALGGWIGSLQVRGLLVENAAELSEGSDVASEPDPVLVQRIIRALGAAAEMWEDDEVPSALEGLLALEVCEDDVTFELGMLHMRSGLAMDTVGGAVAALQQALEWLSRCCRYEDRVDARIFHTALDALLSFSAGASVSEPTMTELRTLVTEYRLASLREHPTWRQPRADATAAWVEFTDRLHALQDLDAAWWDPPALISAIAQAYSAHRTIRLLVPPDIPYADGSASPGITNALGRLLQPRLVNSLIAKTDSVVFLDRWLSLHSNDPNTGEEDRRSIHELQELLHADSEFDDPKGPDVELGATSSVLALSSPVREGLTGLLRERPELAEDLNRASRAVLAARKPDLSDYANTTLEQLRADIDRVTGVSGEAALRVDELLLFLLRYARWAIDAETGGTLGEPFLRPFAERREAPMEVDMAQDLAKRLYTSVSTIPRWEVHNLGAGRTDIVLFYGSFYLVIECKRELDNADMDYLCTRYSVQPAEYGATDIPIGFLVVLDATPKTRKAQLHQCLSVTEVAPAEPGGRPHAVVTVRVQGNTKPPSYSSTPTAHRQRSRAPQA
ncbi:hypothetical protein J7F02_18470 [Streptomyces sp. ISL-112]|uniref:hypothetical protein n=1 Tax=unclassified Streptomyces TaxID=2593676 RepID=UPI001BEB381A|nr:MULTISPECIES: hypothetical protein [unclassified Streptomyces]MBT2427596.1 hypothetical protein [Streptomyces sp. ISL-112]MBT2462652.1 hypothetical protein [Streptomyces sp. ISL-63]